LVERQKPHRLGRKYCRVCKALFAASAKVKGHLQGETHEKSAKDLGVSGAVTYLLVPFRVDCGPGGT
jgi:hypothetical protein